MAPQQLLQIFPICILQNGIRERALLWGSLNSKGDHSLLQFLLPHEERLSLGVGNNVLTHKWNRSSKWDEIEKKGWKDRERCAEDARRRGWQGRKMVRKREEST